MHRIYPKERFFRFIQTEQLWALSLGLWGMFTLAGGIVLYFYKTAPLPRGIGFAIIILGIPLLIIGVRTWIWGLGRKTIVLPLPNDLPKVFLQKEWERVDRLLNQLQRAREITLLFFILGFSLTLLARLLNWNDYSLGLGTGIIIQSVPMLLYLLFRQWRNSLYQQEITHKGA